MRYIECALVAAVSSEVRTRHYSGLPPKLTDGNDSRTPMPHARILLIAEEESGILLCRFTASGEFAGDTWHENVENARHQAVSEYGDALCEWQSVPDDTDDHLAFIRSLEL